MPRIFCLSLVIVLGSHIPIQAVPSPAKEEAKVFTGTISKPFQDAASKFATVIGRHGVLFIHSEARWEELNKLAPDRMPDTPLPKLDFTRGLFPKWGRQKCLGIE
jgi:hypothetical protein